VTEFGQCLKYDVNEMTDLKFSYAEKTVEMNEALSKWQSDTNAQNPVPNPDFDPGCTCQGLIVPRDI
jgi:uncharacterized sulfatase